MNYPGGGKRIQTDTAAKQPKKTGKALKPFRGVLRTIRRGK